MSPETALHSAAALMTMLGPTEALAAFRTLSPEAAKTLRNAMGEAATRIPRPPVGADFQMPPTAVAQSQLSTDAGHYIRSLLKRALSEEDAPVSAYAVVHESELKKAKVSNGEIRPAAAPLLDALHSSGLDDGSGIEKLKTLSASEIAGLLASQHPQIIAVILGQMGTNLAAGVLNNMPPRLCQQVVPRIAGLQRINNTALNDLNEGLLTALSGREATQVALQGGEKAAAEIMDMLGTTVAGGLLDSLRRKDPGLAQRLAQKMTNAATAAG
jgi:flagellar motor switch protein FliG